ncbi:GbpC/Spa domain-containing protein [Streptococcus pluranimalium]|uniref:GbpC/Spa domain-containing protein n=1 Tax=Streptococcus pluranimalium TaxID=82348 RepID=UPI0039FBCAFE
MIKERNTSQVFRGVLFSSALFVLSQSQVLADTTVSPTSTVDSQVTPIESTVSSPRASQPITNSGDADLDSSLTKAQNEGILLVEAPSETVASASEQAQDYQAQAASVDAVTKQYQAEKVQYLKDEQAHKDYLAKQSQYQKDLATYQAYQKEKAIYDQQMKAYNLEKASYDMAYAEAQGNTTKTGYLPEVLAQNLIFRLEPDAVQTITGKVLSDEQLSKAIKNHVGWIDPGTILGSPKLVTVTSRHKTNSVLMAVGDTVVVDYSDLQHSSFSGHTIKTVRYTYRLVSTSHYSGQVVFQALSDPTVTSFTHVYHKDAKTSSAFDMEMTVQFFDANGKELLPTPENYALTSFASLNSLNGEGEYAGDYNGQFIPINGSTITVQNGRAANFSNTRQIDVVGEWDDKDNPNAYIGAIVGKSTERIQFHFGNSKGSAIWFAFNSDVKVSGGLLTPPKAPVAPEVVMKPLAPKVVTKPLAPLRPIVFYHQVKVVIPKPSQAVRPLKPTKRTTSSPNRAKVSPKPSVATVKVSKVAYKPKPIPVYYVANNQSSSSINKVQYDNSTAKKKSVTRRTSSASPKRKNSPKNLFFDNTGIIKQYQKDFLNYLDTVARQAKKAYQQLKNKKGISQKEYVNHVIANALAAPVYEENFLQKLANDFGNVPNNKYSKEGIRVIKRTSGRAKDTAGLYKIDFPHLGAAQATASKSSWYKELVKLVMSYSPLGVGKASEDIVFQLNSQVGDEIQERTKNFGKVDKDTDKDGFIFKYHPDYKNLYLNDAIKKYYGEHNITDSFRNKLYKEAVKARDKVSSDKTAHVKNAARSSIGAFGIKYNVFIKERVFGKYLGVTKFLLIQSITTKILPAVLAGGLLIAGATELFYAVRKKIAGAGRLIKKGYQKSISIAKKINKGIQKTRKKIATSNKKLIKKVQKIHKVKKQKRNQKLKSTFEKIAKNDKKRAAQNKKILKKVKKGFTKFNKYHKKQSVNHQKIQQKRKQANRAFLQKVFPKTKKPKARKNTYKPKPAKRRVPSIRKAVKRSAARVRRVVRKVIPKILRQQKRVPRRRKRK